MPRTNNRRTYSEWTAEPIDYDYEVDDRGSDEERDRLEAEFMRDMDAAHDRDLAVQAELQRIRNIRPNSPIRPNQTGINKTQLRELLAHRNVWDNIPNGTRIKINNAIQSDGRLFRLTNREQSEIRNALVHGRVRVPLNTRLNALLMTTLQWG